MFVSFSYSYPRESQVGAKITRLNLPMEEKEDFPRFKGNLREGEGGRGEGERERERDAGKKPEREREECGKTRVESVLEAKKFMNKEAVEDQSCREQWR